MIGRVDSLGRALVTVSLHASGEGATCDVEAWIDTGFNGDLVLPQHQIDDLELQESGTVKAILADGSEIIVQRDMCATSTGLESNVN